MPHANLEILRGMSVIESKPEVVSKKYLQIWNLREKLHKIDTNFAD